MNCKHILCAIGLATLLQTTAFGIAGIGVHYGTDLSLSMADKSMEQTVFENLKVNLGTITGTKPSLFPADLTTITGKQLPVYVSRKGFTRMPLNLGGKLFIDIIPFINVVEASANIGVWEYDGSITYPDSMSFKTPTGTNLADLSSSDLFTVTNTTVPLTLESTKSSFMGLKKTPYAKLNIDLTVRKNIIKFPPVVNVLKIYAGGGASINFATPVLSSGLITDALGSTLNTALDYAALGPTLFANPDIQKKIVEKIIKDLMTPHFGMHLVAGVSVKPPVIPIGLYVDGKFMIPLAQLDKNVADLKSMGLLLNAGVMFAF